MQRCTDCGRDVGETVFFCPTCGAACGTVPNLTITPIAARRTAPVPQRSALPTDATALVARAVAAPRRVVPREPPLRRFGVPCVGFAFTVVFLCGLAEFIEVGGLPGFGLWPLGVFVGGELVAQEAWVQGRLRLGLPGMILWTALIWLAAAARVMRWV